MADCGAWTLSVQLLQLRRQYFLTGGDGHPPSAPKGTVVDDVLANTPLFSALDAHGAEALRSSLSEMKVSKGQELFHEGEPGEHLYLILDGKVKLGHGAPDGL